MTSPSGHPGFIFRGKTCKTVAGLCNALAKHSGADSISAVSSRNTISAELRAERREVKRYCITPPVAGQKQHVAEAFLPSELDRPLRNALVASAYNVVVACREPGTDHGLPGGTRMSSVGLPDEARQFVMKPPVADGLPTNVRCALLIAYSQKLMAEQQTGQQMLYTFADCDAALQFVNA